jgi:nitric oxide dioxygenase
LISKPPLSTRIFAIEPAAQDLFKFAKDFEPRSEELFASPRLIKHGKGVIKTVNTAVGMLGPDLAPLVGVLQALGKRHAKYGVAEEHFPLVGQALIETLTAAMGDAFTDEVKAAWVEIYGVIQEQMIVGMKQA